ncbi:PDR/VanB family oxidoreductase [Pseudonocardia zijingensis]|uniref:PDR/VanB family oxidoreductase n=1 Tax=Pseudonocardia zijingensis TaxID=153376 RepID=A0ABN1QQR5_9PSEU
MTGTEVRAVVGRRSAPAEDVVEFALHPVAGGELPAWEPGAHVDVVLGSGMVRQYSLCGDPADRTTYRIAVLRQADGRGGSAWLHDRLEVGEEIALRGPRNHFPLEPAGSYVFLAGGIGITPLLPMVRRVAASGAAWTLHYGGRTRASMAYLAELTDVDDLGGDCVNLVPQDEYGLIDLSAALDPAPPETAIYCCGPEPLIAAAEVACAARGLALRTERFSPREIADAVDTAFVVALAASGEELVVPAGRSIVDVLVEAGADILTSCEEGTCGTCELAVLAGTPDHRDSVLTDEERAAGDRILPCVSRASSERLVLDL